MIILPSGNSLAATWSISPEIGIAKQEDKRLHTRTPEINNPADSQIILTSLALRHPFTSLWIQRTSGTWVVRGARGTSVSQINFRMAPMALTTSLKSVTAPYIGQVHSAQLLKKLSTELKTALSNRGYTGATLASQVSDDDNSIIYTFSLDIGEPCVVRGYKWEQHPPIKVDQSLKPGDICDIDFASKAVAETENKARTAGYAEANLSFEGFQFDAGSSSAWVRVSGEFGHKIIYEFVDQATGRSLSGIFTNSEMQLFDPTILSPDSVSFELVRQLRARGYSNAQVVGTTILESGTDEQTHRFNVQLGDSTVISRLQIEGNTTYSETEIFALLGVERPTQAEGQASEVTFNPDAIAAGVERIRAHYVNHGFWDAKVVDRQIQSQSGSGQNGRVVVVISIEEGDQRLFNIITISGNNTIPMGELLQLTPFSKDDPVDRSKIVELQQKIRGYYATRGYFYTSTSAETTSKSRGNSQTNVTIIIRIDEGPRVKFGDIFVTGLVKTNSKVAMRELFFDTGDWYDPELVFASRKALLRIGVFSTATIMPLDPDLAIKRSEVVDMVIAVTESPTKTVNFGPGWSTYYGMRYNIEGALTNIGGMGRQLFGRASFDEEAHQTAIGPRTLLGRTISAGYLEPRILDSGIDGTVSLSQSARATTYAWSLTKGGELELSHSLKSVVPGSKISTFYARKLNDEEGAQQDVDAFLADTFSVGRVGFRFLIDKRNDNLWTSDGYILGSELSWARYNFGGDLRYFRWDVTNNHYFSPVENLVFAFGVNFTSYEDVERHGSTNGDVLPASERLNNGGADTVRGFKEKSLGPIVRRPSLNALNQWDCGFTASPTGGSRRLILKAETRYRFTTSLAGTLFVDSGTASFSRTEIKKFTEAFANDSNNQEDPNCPGIKRQRSVEDNNGYDLGDVASNPKIIWNNNFSSAGTAVNFLTPIGSINLAYGIPWHEPKSKKCQQDTNFCYPRSDQNIPLWRRGEIHFNVGAKF